MVKYYELINWYFTCDNNKNECLCGDYKPTMLKNSNNDLEYNISGIYKFLSHAKIDRKLVKKMSDDNKESPYHVKIDKTKSKHKNELEYYVQILIPLNVKINSSGKKIKTKTVTFKLMSMDRYFKNNQNKKMDAFIKSFKHC